MRHQQCILTSWCWITQAVRNSTDATTRGLIENGGSTARCSIIALHGTEGRAGQLGLSWDLFNLAELIQRYFCPPVDGTSV